MKSNIIMQSNNAKHREKNVSAVLFDVRTLILIMVMTLTMVMSLAFADNNNSHAWIDADNEDNFTYANPVAFTENVTGVTFGKDGTTAIVATFEQLKAALNVGQITEIIIDPQAYEFLLDDDLVNEDGERGIITWDADKFFVPFDEPLTISRAVTIKSAPGVEAVFARSTSTSTFSTQTPALFNIDANGDLTVDGNITMTGDKVSAVIDEGQAYKPAVPAPLLLGSSGIYLGGDLNNATLSTTGHQFVLNDDGLVTFTDESGNVTYYFAADGGLGSYKYFNQGPTPDTESKYVKVLDYDDLEGGFVTQLIAGHTYVLWDDYRDKFITKKPTENKFDSPNSDVDASNVIKFTATAPDGQTTEGTEGKDYIAPEFKFSVANEPWTYGANQGVFTGGYFIHSPNGGTVTLNEGVLLTDLRTNAPNEAMDMAPVYIAGSSELNINGAIIANNTVGYAANEADSKGSIQQIQSKVEGSNMTNTAGGVILKGSGTTANLNSGEITGNKADAGGVIVTDGATVYMGDDFGINYNIGYHHAGAAQVERGGKFIMNGGLMSGNVAWYKGGAVWATQWGTNGYADIDWSAWPSQFPTLNNPGDKGTDGVFVMNGGTLSDNTAFARGGAIEVESNGVTLLNGTIENNHCRSLGGAIYVEGDAQSYSYTLVIENGYIGDNRSVWLAEGSKDGSPEDKDNYALNRYLKDGVLTEGGPKSGDASFTGAMGNGGGVWLCPVGGSSVFANDTVYIDNNSTQRTNGGTDFYLHKGNGAMLVQNIAGNWVDERNNDKRVNYDGENGSVLNGPTALRNAVEPKFTNEGKNVVIQGNVSRNGGGIAANGTLIFGPTEDVDRYDARINITKKWAGITPDKDTKITFEIGFLDNNNNFVPLKDTVTGSNGKELNFEFEMDGKADDDATSNEGSAAGEIAPDGNNWRGSAFIPASVTLSDGNIYPLYEFENPLSVGPETLSPARMNDLKYIRQIIDKNKELKIAEGSWKIKVRERHDSNFNVTIRDIEVNNTASVAPHTTVPLYDPVTGELEEGRSFRVYFTTVELDQEVINEGNGIEFTKLASDTGRVLAGTEFYLTETDEGSNWFVKGTRNRDGGTLQNSTIADRAIHTSPLTPDAQGKVKLTTGMLKEGVTFNVPGDYLLFETKTPAGYVRKTSPWLVHLDELGNVTITEVAPEYQGKCTRGGSAVDYTGVRVDGKDTDSVYNTWWLKDWYTSENAIDTELTLINEWEPITIKKIDASTGSGKQGATFELYEAEIRGDIGVRNSEHNVNIVPVNAETLTSDANGNISLPITKPGAYLLFETNAPTGYVRAKSPWLVYVDANKNTKIVAIQSDKEGQVGYHESSYGWGARNYPSTRAGLNEWVIEKWWRKSWYNLTDNTQTHEKGNTTAPLENPTFQWVSTASDKFVSGNKLPNSKANIELTKTDNAASPAVISDKSAKFMLFESNVSANALFNADGSAKSGVENNQDVKVKDKRSPIGGDSDGFITTVNGKLSLNNLDVNKVYLLFEAEAPDGYERSVTPWLIYVDSFGEYKIYKYVGQKIKYQDGDTVSTVDLKQAMLRGWYYQKSNGSYAGQYTVLGSMIFPTTAEGMDVPTGTNTNGFNYLQQTGEDKNKLKNKPIVIEFEKIVKGNSDKELSTAKFTLYYGKRTKDEANNRWIYSVDNSAGKGKIGSDNSIVYDSTTGKFRIELPKSDQIYLLFETTVPNGYKDPIVPWGIWVDANGSYETLSETDNIGVWKVAQSEADSLTEELEGTDIEDRYLLCDGVEKVTTYELENEKQPIELTKVDEDGNAITVQQNSTETKAKFVITDATLGQKWFVPGTRNDDAGYQNTTIVSQARRDANNNVIYYQADNSGKISITDLPAGNYFLFETQAPSGFERATNPWLIQVTDNSNEYSWNIFPIKEEYKDKAIGLRDKEKTLSPDNQSLGATWWPDDWFDKTESVSTLVNTPKYLLKIDSTSIEEDDDTVTPIYLANAQFDLYEAYTENFGSGSSAYTTIRRGDTIIEPDIVSDEKGRITLPSSITRSATTPQNHPTLTGVKVHGYMLVEKQSPSGYKDAVAPWWITIDSNGEISAATTSRSARGQSKGKIDYWYTTDFTICHGEYVTNEPNELSFTKVDAYDTSKPLRGAVFDVYEATVAAKNVDADGNTAWKANLSKYIGETTPSNDEGKFSLPSGVKYPSRPTNYSYKEFTAYVIIEKTAPKGYVVSDKPWLVVIYRDYNNNITRYVYKAGTLYSGSGTTGAYVFDCIELNGLEIKNYPSIVLRKVDRATVDVAPGEAANTESISISGETQYLDGVTLKLYEAITSGTPTTGTWSKKGGNNAQPMKEVVSEKQGETHGVVDLGALANGNYLLYETTPKNGYHVPAKPWRLVVENGTVTVYVPDDNTPNKYNKLIGDNSDHITNVKIYVMPKSGGMGTYWFMIIGAMLMGFALTAGFTKMNLRSIFRR